ncbi:hypothetical protein LAZ67_X002615 [Cordylochernes scorpioides]|uniref:Transposase Tc1-like domain-containing protein n=1 Tax=Cordylochernes scorpioides TaxID=51811 RepID=A0ABY6LTZ8_9ARAC|nr:hypothetical protein LAZ67_X002615 [Cordylochernes scorpioides]
MPGHRKRRQFKQTALLRGAWNVGATRVTSARVDRRILRQAVAAPQATCTAILQHVQDNLDHSISTRNISRRLVANGLHSCRPLRRLPLTPPNRRQRLEWCRARSTWMTEWHRVVFSDESRFCLSSDSRRVRVWRRRGERSNPAAIVERPTVRQRGIMVWGAIAYDSRSPLLRIQGTMTAQRYVDDVLRPLDNARPHTARISQQALQDVQMLPWPPYSPDLSPIEHVWDIIGRRLHALLQPRSEDELWQMVEREWRAIPQDAIRTLIDSLPRRVAACIAVRGLVEACNFCLVKAACCLEGCCVVKPKVGNFSPDNFAGFSAVSLAGDCLIVSLDWRVGSSIFALCRFYLDRLPTFFVVVILSTLAIAVVTEGQTSSNREGQSGRGEFSSTSLHFGRPLTVLTDAIERSLEQRYAIKFCVRLGKNATETFQMLQKVFKDDCISKSQSGKWHKAFKEGWEEVADEPRSGRPTTARTDENVDRVLDVLRTDRRLSIQ